VSAEALLEKFNKAKEKSTLAQIIPNRESRRPNVQHRRKPFQPVVLRPVKVIAEPNNERRLTRKINRQTCRTAAEKTRYRV
jgi:hypothetical protein